MALPFLLLYKIFLWIALKQPLAGGAAEIEFTSLIRAAMPRSCYLHYHTTDWIKRGFG